ncbi:Hypothetical protein PHPALM_8839 [Phytophthora palmivora]|uniref:WRKY19-like zinc finger domain-containing protein n=1 Tax=Phytophthora palmivora TaxID=4796 RepID=A0A2P4Y8V2_9STRA|nr:Hypothetical protein PHPALM_8839 [Phytophthora palmivora]
MQIFNKASLEFIMNKSENINEIDHAFDTTVTSTLDVGSNSSNTRKHCRSAAKDQKRKARECKVEGCENYVVAKGLCFRHGVRHRELDLIPFCGSRSVTSNVGGKKCSTEGCEASAKHAGLCWRHGIHSRALSMFENADWCLANQVDG